MLRDMAEAPPLVDVFLPVYTLRLSACNVKHIPGYRTGRRASVTESKMPALRGNDRRLGAGQFDPIAEASECADHSGRPVSLGLLAEGWASFLVPDALMQDLPDQAAQPVGNHADRLAVPEPRDITAIKDLEDRPFRFHRGVGRLV